MTIEYIRYTIPTERTETFLAAWRAASEHLKAAPECLAFELARCEEAPDTFILRIEWTSTAGHTQGFRGGPHFRPFLQLIRAFMPNIAEMRHYAPGDIVWRR